MRPLDGEATKLAQKGEQYLSSITKAVYHCFSSCLSVFIPVFLSVYRYLSKRQTILLNLHVSIPSKLNGYHCCRMMMMMLIVTNSSANRENHLQFHCKAQTRATKPQPISACLSAPCSIRLSDPVCFTWSPPVCSLIASQISNFFATIHGWLLPLMVCQ